jgi:hypothetical protein
MSMATINESIEQLTASLQELTAHTYCQVNNGDSEPRNVPVDELKVSEEVESFVAATSAYSEKTRNVSVGTY